MFAGFPIVPLSATYTLHSQNIYMKLKSSSCFFNIEDEKYLTFIGLGFGIFERNKSRRRSGKATHTLQKVVFYLFYTHPIIQRIIHKERY